ncbi:MAG: division/cell wall cluster transcriptional repressor MraZ [bacterium]|nr:division/cell wall cluster transcriptional repressor MraZ [bacterium]
MFRGQHVHTIDKKGRLSIPAAYRNEIQERSDKPPILTNYKNYLALYIYEDWLEIEKSLMSKSKLQPDVAAYTRFVISGSEECAIDSQGRILVPPALREHARLEGKVTLAGVLDCVELWDTQTFVDSKLDTVSRLEEIQVSVDQAPSS